MSGALVHVLDALPFALVAFVLVQNRLALRGWRLALRREHVLAEGLEALQRALVAGDGERFRLELERLAVGWLDEGYNQCRLGALRMPPMPGEPWPRFEPAPLDELDEVRS